MLFEALLGWTAVFWLPVSPACVEAQLGGAPSADHLQPSSASAPDVDERAPTDSAAFAALAELYVQQKRWPEAIEAANKAIAAGLHDAPVFLAKGRAHAALDELPEAESALLEAARLDKRSPEALLLLANAAARHGRRVECEQIYRRILEEVDERCVVAREKLFLLLLNANRLEDAKACLARFSELGISGPATGRSQAMLDLVTDADTDGEGRLAAYQGKLQQLITDYPGDCESRIAMAMSCLAAKDYDRAMLLTRQVLGLDPDNGRARELKALLEAEQLQYDEAKATVRGLLEDYPRDPGYKRSLLELALNSADDETALAVLRDLIQRADSEEHRGSLKLQLIEVLTSAGRHDEAVAEAERWQRESPGDLRRRDACRIAMNKAGRQEDARRLVAGWLADNPPRSLMRSRYIAQLQQTGRNVDAQQQLLDWLAATPDDVELNQQLIALFWLMGQYDGAIEVARTGAELPEYKAVYEELLARSLLMAKRFDEAAAYYRDKAALSQTTAACRELMMVLVQAGRLEEAEHAANRLLQPELARKEAGHPYDPFVVLEMRESLANLYQLMGRQEQAVQQLEEVYAIAPADPRINNDLGYTWADAGLHLEKAERMIRLAVKENPRQAAYLDSLGWVFYKQERFDDAIRFLRLARRFAAAEDPAIFDHLGDALYRSGKIDEAEHCWQKAHDLVARESAAAPDPQDAEIRERASRKLDQLRDHQPVETALVGERPAAATQPISSPAEPASQAASTRPDDDR